MDQILIDLAKCRNVTYAGIVKDPLGIYPPMPLFVLEETEEERSHNAENCRRCSEDGNI